MMAVEVLSANRPETNARATACHSRRAEDTAERLHCDGAQCIDLRAARENPADDLTEHRRSMILYNLADYPVKVLDHLRM